MRRRRSGCWRWGVRARSVSGRWPGCTDCCCASPGLSWPAAPGRHPVTGPELDDLAHQSADDALLAVTAKLGQFRGESRFTTWAYKFVVLEVSGKLGRHFWQRPAVVLTPQDWDRLPDRFGISPAEHAERQDLAAALRRAVEEELTERQRRVFTAIVVHGVAARRAGGPAGFEPQRDLQDDVRRAA